MKLKKEYLLNQNVIKKITVSFHPIPKLLVESNQGIDSYENAKAIFDTLRFFSFRAVISEKMTKELIHDFSPLFLSEPSMNYILFEDKIYELLWQLVEHKECFDSISDQIHKEPGNLENIELMASILESINDRYGVIYRSILSLYYNCPRAFEKTSAHNGVVISINLDHLPKDGQVSVVNLSDTIRQSYDPELNEALKLSIASEQSDDPELNEALKLSLAFEPSDDPELNEALKLSLTLKPSDDSKSNLESTQLSNQSFFKSASPEKQKDPNKRPRKIKPPSSSDNDGANQLHKK